MTAAPTEWWQPPEPATAAVRHPDAAAQQRLRVRPPTIAEILDGARSRIRRVTPHEAHAEHLAGALLIDIRPAAQRGIEGEVPGALVIERNVLEWRLDPTSNARIPQATDHGVRVLVLCSEGYTSSLAAAALGELGLYRATDVIGGFVAWKAAGLPTG